MELLALAKNMEDPELVKQAESKLEAARVQRDAAVAPSIRRDRAQAEVRRLETWMVAKKKTRDEVAQELAAAQTKFDKVEKELGAMQEQLGKAREDLAQAARMAAEEVATDRNMDDEEFSCDGEDEELESEFRGNVEVVRLHRQLMAARSAPRRANAPRTMEEVDRPKPRQTTRTWRQRLDSDLEDDGAWMDDEDLGQVDPNSPTPAPDALPEVLQAWRTVQQGAARKNAEVFGRMVAAKRHKIQQRG